jgi:hypothetical protein
MITILIAAAVLTMKPLQSDTLWNKLYVRDLDSIRALIVGNHPGYVDRNNPGFRKTMIRAYQVARKREKYVADFNTYRIELSRFTNAFQDEHLQPRFKRPFDNVMDAGIATGFRDKKFYVNAVDSVRYGDDGNVMLNAEVLSCDGTSASKLFESRVLSWRGRRSIEADRYNLAGDLLTDYGDRSSPRPSSCNFQKDGHQFKLTLKWAPYSGSLNTEISEGIHFRRLDDERVWVTLPTFSANRDPQLTQMREVIDSVRSAMKSKWKLLVFDLRSNAGGSSSWADQLAEAVFGRTWTQDALTWLNDGVYTEWRVSAGTRQAVHGLLEQVRRRDGDSAQSVRGLAALEDSMVAASRRGDELFGTRSARSSAARPVPVALSGRIVIITTASCFSACLDFLDRFKMHPAVVQVGQVTGVDTDYMENWGTVVSPLVTLTYPLKVYRNRRRLMNEAYAPDIEYRDNIADTARLIGFVTNVLALK